MGLFSTKKKVQVASTVYNLNGDQSGTYQFLKSTVAQAVLAPDSHKQGVGSILAKAHMNGPGMRQERFLDWARTHYGPGLPVYHIDSRYNVSALAVEDEVPNASSYVVVVQSAFVCRADYSLWTERYLLSTYPALYDTDWTSDYDPVTQNLSITPEFGSVMVVNIPDFHETSTYVAVYYYLTHPVTGAAVGDPKLYLYEIGSGNATLDALRVETLPDEEFYPVIPVRLDNVFVTEGPYVTTLYPTVSKAYKKAFGSRIEELIESLEDNPSLGDIDHAFVVFALPLNTQDPAGKAYLYEYLKGLIPHQNTTEADFQTWKASRDASQISDSEWYLWRIAQSDPEHPNYGDPEPVMSAYPPPSVTEVRLETEDMGTKRLDLALFWVTIEELSFSGLGTPGANPGDVWFVVDAPEAYNDVFNRGAPDLSYYGSNEINNIRVFRQTDASSYTVLRIRGLTHQNVIYGGKYVEVRADHALGDPDPSGFLVPIHTPTLQQMSLVDRTQVATINVQIVLNSYEIVRTRWYEQGWFRAVLVMAVVAITVSTGGVGAAGIGILGSNAAVGVALGFTGAMAGIAGAAANMIASAIMTQLITMGSRKLLGDELGTIVGTVTALLTLQGMQAYASTGSFSLNWGELMRVDNLLQLTSSGTSSYGQQIQARSASVYQDIAGLQKDYARQSEEISARTKELGMTPGTFDPMMFTSTAEHVVEAPADFLNRTLMTGSDIADLSLRMIEDFPRASLELPGAFG